jgi:ferredoxin
MKIKAIIFGATGMVGEGVLHVALGHPDVESVLAIGRKSCEVNITPRKNKRDSSCVNCGACVDACNQELGSGRGLFHLGFSSAYTVSHENCKEGLISNRARE